MASSADRADRQFIITLAVAAGAIAVTLLGWTNHIGGYLFLAAMVLLLAYAGFYSRLGDDNFFKRYTHDAVKGWSAYVVMLGAFVAIFAINFLRLSSLQPDGLKEGWPDAIRCKIAYDGMPDASEFIFYFNGIKQEQSSIGPVANYFLVGGSNASGTKLNNPEARAGNGGMIGYAPNELWFKDDSSSHRLVLPKDLIHSPTSYDEVYMDLGYIGGDSPHHKLDCGGNTIEEIIHAGNAYSFARKM